MQDPSIREEFMHNKFAARFVLDFSRLETGVFSVRQISVSRREERSCKWKSKKWQSGYRREFIDEMEVGGYPAPDVFLGLFSKNRVTLPVE
jgi:hypothetical protein